MTTTVVGGRYYAAEWCSAASDRTRWELGRTQHTVVAVSSGGGWTPTDLERVFENEKKNRLITELLIS